ncbi:UPF0722 protein C11orf88 homolog isoform X8 [Esox lucius]|uniref:UPF0722 protein C11orf88 homolog isoform X8 n=1 Tax=Esox lucius TaxID=8010 RepID=UPI0010BD0982|nr:UPF0722 protein C11orf88 homolog isoform X8 [Esox lucius]
MCDSETCAGEPEKRQAEQLTLEAEFNKYFTVFDGSSPEDVSHAKQLWTSLSLLPLLESRLISADISQRLPVAKTNHESTTAVRPSSSDLKAPGGFSLEAETGGKAEAKQRLEIISLLHQQRQNRIQKETVSLPYKPRHRDKSQRLVVCPPKDLETDVEEVQKLQ